MSDLDSIIISVKQKEEKKFAFSYDKSIVRYNASILPFIFGADFFEEENLGDGDTCKIRLVIHSAKELFKGQVSAKDKVYHFAQEFLEQNKDVGDTLPIIHITLVNTYVDALYGDESLPRRIPRSFQIMDNSIWNYLVPLISVYDIDPEGKKRKDLTLQENFYQAVESIWHNYNKKLYKLKVAQEFADLNARLIRNSFLSEAHASGVSPFIFHSESVTKRMIKKEFLGINDTIRRIKGQKWRILLVDDKAIEAMENDDEEELPYSWNCKLAIIMQLFGQKPFELKNNTFCRDEIKKENFVWCKKVDGKLVECEQPEEKDEKKENFVWRKEVDGKLVECEQPEEKDVAILIEYAQSKKEAMKKLKNKKYDIVLLDYLLNEKDCKHYGYELLEDIYTFHVSKKLINEIEEKKADVSSIFENINNSIKYEELWKFIKSDNELKECYFENSLKETYEKGKGWMILIDKVKNKIEKEKYKIGPQKRSFFIFISAYSSAVYERLLAQGLNQSEDYWFISVGACPTNTPQLFLYNLIKLMEKRLDDSGILKLSSSEIYKLINIIYLPKEEDHKSESVRKRANAHYQEVLSLQYHYRNILRDVEIPFGEDVSVFDTKGSVLMTNFIQKKINLGGMLEHLTQLVHLTAFGTIRQWPEMWEEYIYFKAQFEKQLDEDNDSVENEKLRILFLNIERYILDLKSQQQ